MKSIAKLIASIAAAAAILFAVGNIGGSLVLCNSSWGALGVQRESIRNSIASFPYNSCPDFARPACKEMSSVVLWFTGLDSNCR